MPSSTFQHLPNAPIFLKAQRSGGRRGVKRPRGRGAWMGAGLRAQIEKYNNKVIRSGGHWFVTGEGPLPILQYIYIYIIYHISYIICCVYWLYNHSKLDYFFFENCPLEISTENSARLWNYDFSRSVMRLADAVLDLQHEPGRMGKC